MCALISCLLTIFTSGELTPSSYEKINRSLTEHHIIPGYQKLADTSLQLSQAAQSFCISPDEEKFLRLRLAYHSAMDAWMGIQHIRFGPANEDVRSYKIQFWPDKKGVVNRHLKKFLVMMENGVASPEKLQAGSVAIQGFPAIEQLLYSQSQALLPQNEQSGMRCLLLEWITANLSQVTHMILQEWQSPYGYRHIVNTAGKENEIYFSEKEVTQDLLTSWHAQLQFIDELKISAPLGKNEKKARYRRAESWRSERSLRNIKMNLQALRQLYHGKGCSGFHSLAQNENRALTETLKYQFHRIMKTAQSISSPLTQSVLDSHQRTRIEAFREELKLLRQLVETQLTAALGINIGFNAFDGD